MVPVCYIWFKYTEEERTPIKIINEKLFYRRYPINFVKHSFGIKVEGHHKVVTIGVPYLILAAEVLRIEIVLFVLLGASSFFGFYEL